MLERFYDARHKVEWLSLHALSTHVTIQWTQLANICEQLGQHGIITWKALKELHGTATGMGKITAHGVDVVEGTARAPITITQRHDQSIKVSGSTNVQIGNANAQSIHLEIRKLIAAIDGSTAGDGEKAEAKSLIEKMTRSSAPNSATSRSTPRPLSLPNVVCSWKPKCWKSLRNSC